MVGSGLQVVRAPLCLNVNKAENTVIVCLLGVSPAGGHFVSTRKYVNVRWGIRLARRQPARTPTDRPTNTKPYVADHPPRSGVKRSADSPVQWSRREVKGPRNPGQGVDNAPDGL